MERLLIFGVLSLSFAWGPWQQVAQDILGDSDDSVTDASDSLEDSGNPISNVLDSAIDAVKEAVNQSSIDTDSLDEAQDSNDCSLGQTWCDALSKCLSLREDCVTDTEDQDDSLEAPGQGSDNSSISVNSSTESSRSDENFVSTSVNDSNSSSDDGYEDFLEDSDDSLTNASDSLEDSGNLISNALDSAIDAVEEAVNQSSIDTDILDDAQDSNDCSLGETWCDALSKCLSLWEDCVNDTEDDSLEAPGQGSDNTSISVNSSTESSVNDDNFISTSVNDSSSSSDDGLLDLIADSDDSSGGVVNGVIDAVEDHIGDSDDSSGGVVNSFIGAVEDTIEDIDDSLGGVVGSVVEPFVNQSSIGDNINGDDGVLDHIEDSDDSSGGVVNSVIDAVEDTIEDIDDSLGGVVGSVVEPFVNQSSIGDNINGDDGVLGDIILNLSGIDIGGVKDSYGCLTSAGYSWCDTLSKCLRDWEEDCVYDDMLPILGGDDENGCVGSAGYSWCEKLEDCLLLSELIGDWDELCDISYEDAPISEDESTSVDNSSFSSDDGYYDTKDGCNEGDTWYKGCSKKFYQTKIFISIVILTCLTVLCLCCWRCWQLRRKHIRAKRAAIVNIISRNSSSMNNGGERVGETAARKRGDSTSSTGTTTSPDYKPDRTEV